MNTNSSVVLHLDSQYNVHQLQSGLTTNYIYNMVEPIMIPENESCEVSLYSATIPYSFYNVRDNVNNEFKMEYTSRPTLNGAAITEVANITLEPGNYNALTLKTHLLSRISALSDLTYPNINQLSFTISYSRPNIKYTFNLVSVGTTFFESLGFYFKSSNRLFGFSSGEDEHAFGGPGAQGFQSQRCIDIHDSLHGLYLRQNLTTRSTLDNRTGTFSNILARIPINCNAGGVIFHTPANSTHRALTTLHSIQSLGIKLTDDANNTIDLNGLHFQISILVSFVKREPKRIRRIAEFAALNNRVPKPKTKKKPNKKSK